MKKFTSKVFAGIFAAAVMASAAFAADYSSNPDYGKPTSQTVAEADVTAAVTAATGDTVKLDGKGAALDAKATAALKEAKKAVEIKNDDVTVAISAEEVAKLPEKLDLSMGVTTVTEETTLSQDVKLPKNATMIKPAAKGAFGVKVSVTVPVSSSIVANKAKLYHVDDKGVVTEVKDALEIKDGVATITIDSASYYVISDGEVTGAKADDGKGDDTPDTGVVLPIALVALAGGSVAVSAIAAKKRK